MTEVEQYTCPMHPEVMQEWPGSCPICGMVLELISASGDEDQEQYREMLRRFCMGAVLSLPILLLSFFEMFPWLEGAPSPQAGRLGQFLFATPVVLWAGWPFFVRAWHSLLNRSLNMFTLIAMGVGTSYLYSLSALFFYQLFPPDFLHQGLVPVYFESAAIITVLVLLGQVLELKARSQTGSAIRALLGRAAKSARIIEDGNEREIAIEQVRVGDKLRVRPGDKVPVDGFVIEGTSTIDESMITGESIPNAKSQYDEVVGGTLNQSGSFVMEASKIGSNTLLARIVQKVAEAQRSKAPIQTLADQVSGYFVPLVILIAVLTFIGWAMFGPQPSMLYGLVNGVAVLIIACPCALGLATPMSVMVGMGRGAEEGILIKNAAALEKLENISLLITDKTGTLTEGKPKLSALIALSQVLEDELIQYAAAVEQLSEHPLASAIYAAAEERRLELPRVEGFKSKVGEGVSGRVLGKDVLVGKLSFLRDCGVDVTPFAQEAQKLQEQGQSVLFVAFDNRAAGLLAVSDPIKASSSSAIERLHELGVKVVMVTGDNTLTARAVAKKLHIDTFFAGVAPLHKQSYVKEFRDQEEIVAVAGDGINDAPALAEADVGIAMGTGTDIAMESADVTLVKGDLMGVVRAFKLSKAMMRNIRQNLFFAFIYNVCGVIIAAGALYPLMGILLNPIIAALAMSLSSVSVILNSLRLKTK